MANKKSVKKVENKKEEVKVEKVKTEDKRILTNFRIAVLYTICALCWIASGTLEYSANKKIPYLDICVSIILIILAIVYFRKNDSK